MARTTDKGTAPPQAATPGAPTGRTRSALLMRGESLVASWGLALAAILLLVMGAAGVWAHLVQRDAHRALCDAALRSRSSVLAQSAERLLAAGDVSGVRRLVMEAAGEVGHERLGQCRIVMGDGAVLADAEPSRITMRDLPERFPPGPPPEGTPSGPESISLRTPVSVPGHGLLFLDMAVSWQEPAGAFWQLQAGIGLIGAAGLSALLLVYRRMRSRLRGLGAVRDALLALGRGESSAGALAVSPDFGPEAQAWNRLLNEREQLTHDLLAERAREALAPRRDAGADLGQACDAMWQGLVLIDEQGKVRYANGAAAVFLRARREAMQGRPVAEFLRDPKLAAAAGSIGSGGLRTRASFEVKRDEEAGGGGGVLRLTLRPVRRDDGASAILVIEDVTQQRVADAARNAFVAQATHELRTPLTNIRLYAEQAVDEGENDPQVRANCLNVINQESRRLERIVGDMLGVAEIEAGSMKLRPGDVRLETVFAELEADYRAQAAEKRQTLRFELPPKWPTMRGDRDKLVLALHNLIGNALKYTPEGGAVTVRVQGEEDRLTVEVADTGIGIREDEQELIFEKFYRSKDGRVARITGTGLGLALARDVVRLHGGDIQVRSQLDRGSTFTLSVPTRLAA